MRSSIVGNFASQAAIRHAKGDWSRSSKRRCAPIKAAIDNTKTTLDYATIRSPIDGRAGIRLVDVGNILHASDQTGIVVITQLKPIYVVFTLPQQALPAVQKAQARKGLACQALGPDNATLIEIGRATRDRQPDRPADRNGAYQGDLRQSRRCRSGPANSSMCV